MWVNDLCGFYKTLPSSPEDIVQIRNWRPENQMFLIVACIAIAGLIIFLSLIPVHKWLWAGWLFGVTTISIGYVASVLLIKLFLRKKQSKFQGFISGIARSTFNFVFQIGMLFVLIAVDTSYHGLSFGHVTPHILVEGPIVFYTYLGGISVVALSSITTLLIKKKEGANERVRG